MKYVARVAIVVSLVVGLLNVFGLIYLFVEWGPGSAEPRDIVGTWTGPRGAQVTLREDGTAIATNMPTAYSGYDYRSTISGTGTWSLPRRPDIFVDQAVKITIPAGRGERETELEVDGPGARHGMHVPVDVESALGIDFHKAS
ncbi:hypothetical protein [Streptomyces sp. NPDC017529]|uniref:hypothetical protein n=1 Tax=Streptomyces sp. NPDC017529 TaxID=3365000 RepID=UPI0037AB40AF